ncbi:hypothetical protein ABZW11_00940 [Nonomuraea sp. NPDC004580]|uniref:hypothetical protein n=1 Tax=Nonomuraea sp. NPDC004580 TaxID=3154552 RepID=UPI00339F987C
MPVTVEQLKEVPYVRRWMEVGEARGEARGEAKGEAKIIIMMLRQRGISLSPEDEERIRSCTDPEKLENWASKVLKVHNVDELFD